MLSLSILQAIPAHATTTCATKSTNHGGYVYTAFKSVVSGCTWDVPVGISAVDMLIVAGGGGGGPRHSGGGGAGGVLKLTAVALTNISTLAITVGAGGAGAYVSGSTVEATNGSNSVVAKSAGTGTLTTQTAIGGGKGSQSAPATGGSGGGTYSGSGAAGTGGQGSAGATGGSSLAWYGGGGGGAGQAGTNGTSTGGGKGGNGVTWVSSFDTTTATRLKLTDLTGYFGGGGGGGITASSGPVSGGAGGTGGGGNGGGDGNNLACGRVGAMGCDGVANTGGGGGGAGLKQLSTDSPGGAGGSGVVIFRYTITDTVEITNYGAATSCIWGVNQNYAFLFNSGSGNAITKMRLQFDGNAMDSGFNATRIEIWSNNAGATGSLVGFLNPSSLAASSTAAGATVATRVGTYTGSTQVLSNTNYWFVVKYGGILMSMCQGSTSVTSSNSWAMVMSSSNFTMRVNGTYTTYPTAPIFEITTGTPDYLEAVITGPNSATGATATDSTLENAGYSFTLTADEYVDWTKSGNDSAAFGLTTAGVLTLGSKNYEVPTDANTDGVYEVTITATDIGGNVSTQALSLTITNDNDAPVITINGGAATSTASAAENQTAVITFTATDEDSGTVLGWYFADNSFDQSKFNINTTTGVLTFKVAPDYENPTDTNADNVYKVNILVFDGSLTATQLISVSVTDIVENSTIATPSISATAYKGVALVITVVGNTPGKVKFFFNGKKIPTCIAVSTSGSAPTATATCSFKPAVQGTAFITAQLTPTNTGLSGSTSPRLVITVLKRTTRR